MIYKCYGTAVEMFQKWNENVGKISFFLESFLTIVLKEWNSLEIKHNLKWLTTFFFTFFSQKKFPISMISASKKGYRNEQEMLQKCIENAVEIMNKYNGNAAEMEKKCSRT